MKTVSWMIIFALILLGSAVWVGNGKGQDTVALESSEEEVTAWDVEEGPTDADLEEPEFDEEDVEEVYPEEESTTQDEGQY